jgi:hypothetical protein
VGVEQAYTAESFFKWQGLAFELYAVGSKDLRTDVGLSRRLYVLPTPLEHDLRITDRKAVLVRDPPPQNKSVVVQAEVFSVDEEYLTDL